VGMSGGAIGRIQSPVGSLVAHTIVGGTASKLSGGKFRNGAATAAFSWALSQAANTYRNGGTVQDVHSTNGDASAENVAAFQEKLDALAADRTLNPYKTFDSADAAAAEVLNVTAPL